MMRKNELPSQDWEPQSRQSYSHGFARHINAPDIETPPSRFLEDISNPDDDYAVDIPESPVASMGLETSRASQRDRKRSKKEQSPVTQEKKTIKNLVATPVKEDRLAEQRNDSWPSTIRFGPSQRANSIRVDENGSPCPVVTSPTGLRKPSLVQSLGRELNVSSRRSRTPSARDQTKDSQGQTRSKSIEPEKPNGALKNLKPVPSSPLEESQAISGYATEDELMNLSSDLPVASPFTNYTDSPEKPETKFMAKLKEKMDHLEEERRALKSSARRNGTVVWKDEGGDTACVKTPPTYEIVSSDSEESDAANQPSEDEVDYEGEWERNLRPHQKEMLNILFRCSRVSSARRC